jgi:hypothetical protein
MRKFNEKKTDYKNFNYRNKYIVHIYSKFQHEYLFFL